VISSQQSRTELSQSVSGAQTNIYAEEPERLAAFYIGLGMAERFRYPAAGKPEHIELAVGGFTLGLTSRETMHRLAGVPVTAGPPQSELVLWCANVAGQFSRSLELSGRQVAPPQVFNNRILAAWVEDPEGNRVKLVSLVQSDPPAPSDA
jgi:lactoylglutathione lyase